LITQARKQTDGIALLAMTLDVKATCQIFSPQQQKSMLAIE
jgi:hypothetical protein